jgi:hypothetical protein
VQQGSYVLIPSAPTETPSIPILDGIGGNRLVVFRAHSISASVIDFIHVISIFDPNSQQLCEANATQFYGPPGSVIHWRRVAAGAAAINFTTPIMALLQFIHSVDPALVQHPPQQPNDPLHAIAGLLQGQQFALSAAKTTSAMALAFNRMSENKRLFANEGTYDDALSASMFPLGGGPPDASRFKPVYFFHSWREVFYTYAGNRPDRTFEISDKKLMDLLLLDFSQGLQIKDFATPSDLPVSWNNVQTLVSRVGSLMARAYGPDLPIAIINCVRDLRELSILDATNLTVDMALTVVQRRLHDANKHPLFDVGIAADGLPPGPKLATYFAVAYTNQDVHRILQSVAPAAAAMVPAAQSGRGNKRKQHQLIQPKTSQAIIPYVPPIKYGLRSASSIAATSPSVQWYRLLFDKYPSLEGKLPCLYWLSRKGKCKDLPLCQNDKNQQPHVNHPEVIKYMNEILEWLQLDPRKRF